MKKALLALALLVAIVPLQASAAEVSAAQSLVASDIQPGNAYLAGGTLAVVAPVNGDLLATGGSITVSEPVSGDVLLAGGSVDVRSPIQGDARVLGGHVTIESSIGGDLVGAGGVIDATGTPSFVYLAGGSVTLHNGAKGPVRIYGGTVTLAGEYSGDVTVTVSDRLSLAPGTVIHGALLYDAPQEADIPSSARVDGGVHYTGSSYLPTAEQAKTFALAGVGVFLLIRLLALLIAIGLLAGIFPVFAEAVSSKVLVNFSRFALLALLGFGVIVATPILLLLLVASFAGIGIALVAFFAYMLVILLGYLYTGVIVGAYIARHLWKREYLLWRDAVIGMLVFTILTSIPFIGWFVMLVGWTAATGAIVSIGYIFAFPRDIDDEDDLTVI